MLASALFASTLIGCPKPVSQSDAAAASASVAPPFPGSASCGDVGIECGKFDRVEDAFLATLTSDPAVLAVGEAHAQKGASAASSAKRFTDLLLPLLAGRASDLLVELMLPPKGCAKQAETMRSVQKPIVTQQAETNQSEYVIMGDAARKLGIVPDLLRPSCDDLGTINDAGEDAIDTSLRTIARLTTNQAEKMLDRSGKKLVVTYGGALHNDAAPPPERAAWAFGPALSAYAHGRYVELDLYVAEFIEDTDTWRKLPWYAAYEKSKSDARATLFRLAPNNFVLVFAHAP